MEDFIMAVIRGLLAILYFGAVSLVSWIAFGGLRISMRFWVDKLKLPKGHPVQIKHMLKGETTYRVLPEKYYVMNSSYTWVTEEGKKANILTRLRILYLIRREGKAQERQKFQEQVKELYND